MATSLQDREQQAGNAPDDRNVGDKQYRRNFNPSSRHDDIDDYDRSADGLDEYDEEEFGRRKPNSYTDAHGDRVRSNYNADDDISDVRRKEASGGGSSPNQESDPTEEHSQGRLMGALSRKAPTAGIVGILLFGMLGIGGGSMSLAGSLLVNIKEMFHNDRSDGTRSGRLFGRAVISNTVNNEDGCKNAKPIKCQASMMSKERVKMYQDNDFKMKGKVVGPDGKEVRDYDGDPTKLDDTSDPDGSRLRIQEIEYPDGTKVNSGPKFFEHEDGDVNSRRVAKRSFNTDTEHYRSKTYGDFLKRAFGFTRSKKAFPNGEGDNGKVEQDKAFNRQTGLVSDEDARNGGLDGRAREIADSAERSSTAKKLGRGGAVGSVIQGYCSTYHLARAGEALVKAYHMIQIVRFGLMFLQAADEIKDGRGDGPKTTYLSNNLTYYEKDPNSEKYNLSATDAEAYKTAAYGDPAAIKEFSEKFIIGGTIGATLVGFTNAMEKITSTPGISQALGGNDTTQREKMRRLCRVSNSGTAMLITACAGVPSALIAAGTASAPGFGTALGAAASIGACACTAQALVPDKGILDEIANYGIMALTLGSLNCEQIAEQARFAGQQAVKLLKSQWAQDRISDVLQAININSDEKGVDAGNIIGVAAGLMLSKGAMGGNRPAKSDNKNQDVTKYITYTQPLEDKYIELAKADAKLAPFDATNEYSLMGSLVRSLNLNAVAPQSLFGTATTLSTLLPAAVDTMIGARPANALYSQPSTAADGASGRYDHCDAQNLKEMNGGKGVTGDKFCSVVAIQPEGEMEAMNKQAHEVNNREINNLIDWMTARHENKEGNGADSGTYDDGGDCANLDGSDDPDCENSKQASIDDNGAPIKNSQYDKFLTYCDIYREMYWGEQTEPYEQGSDRDQDWYDGDQCLKDTYMMRQFRLWTGVCRYMAVLDGKSNCYEQAPKKAKKTGVWECPVNTAAGGVQTQPPHDIGNGTASGVDYGYGGNPVGPPAEIRAVRDGTVIEVGPASGYGNWIIIQHEENGKMIDSYYGHMRAQDLKVKVGQEVTAGDVIAYQGNEGKSTAPHVHVGLRMGNSQPTAEDYQTRFMAACGN